MLNRVCFGEGPPLVFIHGWAADNGVWETWIRATFADRYRCILIELPGHGASPPPPILSERRVAAWWLRALNEALPDEPAIIVGWSLGGMLAQCLACRHPERVRALVLLATSPRFIQVEGWTWGVPPRLLVDFVHMLGRDVGQLLKRFWSLQWHGDARAKRLMRQFVQEMRQRRLPRLIALRQGLLLLKQLDCRAYLSRLSQPVLWLLGERDPLIRVEMIQQLVGLQPHARVTVLPQAAHLPFRAWPDETAAALNRFLDSLAQSESGPDGLAR